MNERATRATGVCLVATLSGLALAGCSLVIEFPGDFGRACNEAGQCIEGFHCENNVCVQGVASHSLNVSVAGSGSGGVTSSPAGIDCPGSSCVASYTSGTTVTLVATPAAHSTFTGWSGGCSGEGVCTIPMIAAATVSATFSLATYPLKLILAGAGTGFVSSSPDGINCPTTCTASYVGGTLVTLTATPTGSSAFLGWGGSCSGTDSCTLPMTSASSVTANFSPTYVLSVALAGNGGGTVSSSPAGIDCPSGSCAAPYVSGASVILTATPDRTSSFAGWSGVGCSLMAESCTIPMLASALVNATFKWRSLQNGGFENELTGWTTSGLVSSVAGGGRTGTGNAAELEDSGSPDEVSSLSQTFAVPLGGGTLVFWYSNYCSDPDDKASATLLDHDTQATTDLFGPVCDWDGNWVRVATSLAGKGGHLVTLTLSSSTDGDRNYSYTLYDDVTLQ